MLSDLRIAARALRKNPVFSATAVAVLALGIGANSAVFGLVNQALFSPEGLSQPDRVVAVRARYLKLGMPSISISGPDFRDVRDARDVFQQTAVAQGSDVVYEQGGEPRVLRASAVSREWFDVFGARPLLGRTFVAEEDEEGGQRAIVLAHAAWVRVFGSDASIVGRLITVDGKPTKVVGVMPDGFQWPREVDAWVPLGLPRVEFTDDFRFNEHLLGVARLRPGVTVESANTRVQQLAERVRGAGDRSAAFARSSQWSMFVVPLTQFVAGDSRTPMLVLLGAVSFVLLIACANIAGLMLARTASRQREIAVRAALGAGRWQLARQTLAESALLSAAGAFLGLGFAWAGMRLMIVSAPEGSAVGLRPSLDPAVLLFTSAAGVVSALLFAVAPAWHVGEGGAGRAPQVGDTRGHRQHETAAAAVCAGGGGDRARRGPARRRGPADPQPEPATGRHAGLRPAGRRHRRGRAPRPPVRDTRTACSLLPGGARPPAAGSHGCRGRRRQPDPVQRQRLDSVVRHRGQAAPVPASRGLTAAAAPSASGISGRWASHLRKGRVFTDDDRLGTDPVVVIDENLARALLAEPGPAGQAHQDRLRRPLDDHRRRRREHRPHATWPERATRAPTTGASQQRPQSGAWLVARIRRRTRESRHARLGGPVRLTPAYRCSAPGR